MEEKVIKISEIHSFKIQPINKMEGKNGSRLGMAQMINALGGYGEYDGYKIETDKNTHYVLIENGQSCCESWGYITSNDNLDDYIGKILKEIVLTDTALDKKKVEDLYCEDNQIQFVDFKFTDGEVLQLAVYNSHNGYYGHSIVVGNEKEVLLTEVL
ncbi:MAG TPA: hypothetical protein PLG34_13595 [Spirochaetota bacterium]|nr:hypothetical protein [Spirochaetota bacterium]